MNKKNLIVRYVNDESSFTVTGTEEKILAFTKWTNEYNHGSFDGINTINCTGPIDFRACRQKAKRENLIPCMSKDEIKKNILCN